MAHRILGLVVAGALGLAGLAWWAGRAAPPVLASPSPQVAQQLATWVEGLCALGPRNLSHRFGLGPSEAWVQEALGAASGRPVQRERIPLPEPWGRRLQAHNLSVAWIGEAKPQEWVIIGAHYDTHPGVRGADDNASGLAMLLGLAQRLQAKGLRPQRSLRLVAFANEEAPFFAQEGMGSWAHARACRSRGEQVVGMISLESLGYYRSEPGTQRYPSEWLGLFFPDRGNFVGVVGNLSSWGLVHRVKGGFASASAFPLEASALPEAIPGVGWSDQWGFWQEGYPAVMLTDTAVMRNPNYHTPADLPTSLRPEAMAQVLEGVVGAWQALDGG